MSYYKDSDQIIGTCGEPKEPDPRREKISPVERSHHPYSPSGLQNFEACPCFQSRNTAHVRAIAGTIAHSAAEAGEDDNRLSDEDAEAVAECLDFVERRRQIFEEARQRDVSEIGVLEIKEQYLPIDDLKFEDAEGTTAGYIDHGFISHDRKYAELYDWKFGFWPVEDAANNLQGLAYLLGVFKRFPTVQRAKFFFKQPLIDSISDVELTRADIAKVYLRIQTVVERARAARQAGDFASATPRIPACNFCANVGKCPKVSEFACKVGAKFYPLEIPSEITPSMLHSDRDTTLGMRLASVMEVWAKAYKAQTTDRVIRRAADVPPGYCIQTRSTREIVNAEAFRKISLNFLTEAEYNALLEPPGFGKLEDTIKEKAPRGQKKSQVVAFNTALTDAGATQQNVPYAFLKAVAAKSETVN